MSGARTPFDFDHLYRQHGHVVLRRARDILRDDAEAQEILQEVFVSLIDRPEQFSGRSTINTFLYQMTTNLCLNKIRNRLKRDGLLAMNITDRSTTDTSEERIAASELLASLPDRLATVAIYYYIDEMSQDEIGEILGCSRRMVGKLVSKLHAHVGAAAA